MESGALREPEVPANIPLNLTNGAPNSNYFIHAYIIKLLETPDTWSIDSLEKYLSKTGCRDKEKGTAKSDAMHILERLLQRKEKPPLILKRAKSLLEAMHDETLRLRVEHKRARERAKAREVMKDEALAAAIRTRPNVHVTGSNIYESFNVTNADAYHDQRNQHYVQGPVHLPQTSPLSDEPVSAGKPSQEQRTAPSEPMSDTERERPTAVESGIGPLRVKEDAPDLPTFQDRPSTSQGPQPVRFHQGATNAEQGNNVSEEQAENEAQSAVQPGKANTSLGATAEPAGSAPSKLKHSDKMPSNADLGAPAVNSSTSQHRPATSNAEAEAEVPSSSSSRAQNEKPSPAELKAEATSGYNYQFKNPLFSHKPTRKARQKPSALQAILSRSEGSRAETTTSSGTSNKSPKRKASETELVRLLLNLGVTLRKEEDGCIKILDAGRKRRRLSVESQENASETVVAARAAKSTASDSEDVRSPSSTGVRALPPASSTLPAANEDSDLGPLLSSSKRSPTRVRTSKHRAAVSPTRDQGTRPGIGRFKATDSAMPPPTSALNTSSAGDLDTTEIGQENSPAPQNRDSLFVAASQKEEPVSAKPAVGLESDVLSLLKVYGGEDDDDDEDEDETAKVSQQEEVRPGSTNGLCKPVEHSDVARESLVVNEGIERTPSCQQDDQAPETEDGTDRTAGKTSASLKMRPCQASQGKEDISRATLQALNGKKTLHQVDKSGLPSSNGLYEAVASERHLATPAQPEKVSKTQAEEAAGSFDVQHGTSGEADESPQTWLARACQQTPMWNLYLQERSASMSAPAEGAQPDVTSTQGAVRLDGHLDATTPAVHILIQGKDPEAKTESGEKGQNEEVSLGARQEAADEAKANWTENHAVNNVRETGTDSVEKASPAVSLDYSESDKADEEAALIERLDVLECALQKLSQVPTDEAASKNGSFDCEATAVESSKIKRQEGAASTERLQESLSHGYGGADQGPMQAAAESEKAAASTSRIECSKSGFLRQPSFGKSVQPTDEALKVTVTKPENANVPAQRPPRQRHHQRQNGPPQQGQHNIQRPNPKSQQQQQLTEVPAPQPVAPDGMPAAPNGLLPAPPQAGVLSVPPTMLSPSVSLSASDLAAAPPQQQKNILGEKLYPLAQRLQGPQEEAAMSEEPLSARSRVLDEDDANTCLKEEDVMTTKKGYADTDDKHLSTPSPVSQLEWERAMGFLDSDDMLQTEESVSGADSEPMGVKGFLKEELGDSEFFDRWMETSP